MEQPELFESAEYAILLRSLTFAEYLNALIDSAHTHLDKINEMANFLTEELSRMKIEFVKDKVLKLFFDRINIVLLKYKIFTKKYEDLDNDLDIVSINDAIKNHLSEVKDLEAQKAELLKLKGYSEITEPRGWFSWFY